MFYSANLQLAFWAFVAALHFAELASSKDTCTVDPTAKGLCAYRGDFDPADYDGFWIGEPAFVHSLEECALLCSRRAKDPEHDIYDPPYCKGIEFDTHNGLCQLTIRPFKRIIKPHSGSSHIFYDIDCFTCPKYCPQRPFGVQVLDNPDFNGKLLGPWISTSGALVNQGRNSSGAWKCVRDLDSPCILAQAFNPCLNTLYAVRFFYKEPQDSSNNRSSILLEALYLYEDGATQPTGGPFYFQGSLGIAHRPSSPSWKEGSLFVQIGPALSASRFFYGTLIIKNPQYFTNYGLQGYLVDDFTVFPMDPNPELKHGAQSVIVNGGFETGHLDPWAIDTFHHHSNISVVSPGLHSDHAVKFMLRNSTQHPRARGSLEQMLETTTGSAYLFRFDVRVPDDGASHYSEADMTITLRSGHSLVSYDKVFTFSDNIKSVSIPFIAYGKVTSLKLLMQFATIIIDNVSLIELAAPIF